MERETLINMERELFSNTPMVQSQRILYTPSVFARSSLFHLQEVGTLTALHPHKSSRTGLDSYLFFTVRSGTGQLQYHGKIFELQTGDCVFLDCRKPYSHTTGFSSDNLWELQWCHFYGPNMAGIYAKYLERGGKSVFQCENVNRYQKVLQELYGIADSADYVRDMKIHGKLSELLIFLMEDSWNPNEKAIYHRTQMDIQDVKEYIDSHYKEKISLDQLAADFYINKYYLSKMFKERYAFSIADYVIHTRITEGKRLLRFSDMTVENISEECGMSPHYFSRQFKKLEGMTPGEYRKAWASAKREE